MGVLLVLLIWLWAGAVCVGTGALICGRVFRFRPRRSVWSTWFWTGMVAVCALALLVHFVLPISGWMLVALSPIALAGGWLEGHRTRAPRVAFTSVAALTLIMAGVWIGICAIQALQPATATDDGLYFVQTALWFRSYAAVPGLAALHPCLGHNQTYFFWVSLFSIGPLYARPWVAANGLLLIAAALPALRALAGLIAGPRNTRVPPSEVMQAVLLGPLLDVVLSPAVSSPVADAAVFAISVPILAWVADACTGEMELSEVRWMVALAVIASTLKQPIVCITGPALLVCLARPWREVRKLIPAFLAAGTVVLAWMAHGVLLSGYPLYPLPMLGFPVDWKLPAIVPRALTEYTFATHEWDAAAVRPGLIHAHWAAQWFAKRILMNRLFVIPALAAVSGWVALAVARVRRRAVRPALAFGLVATFGILVWWNMLPDERFAGALLWAAVFGLLALLLPARSDGPRGAWVLVSTLAIAGGLWPLPNLHLSASLPAPPSGREKPLQLRSGDMIWTADDGLCFKLPCALFPYPTLELRRPGDLSAGFRRSMAGPFLP